ncbi:PAS domain-containing hybrid sensor histidine kinase/response regulator [Chlorogloeopsis fritschii]|uniref:PAS domain-containing hybrid sensor histidine kinase/response regulator n=1 Tax=Chlorogloeopsis fritschii TaxID=1124 RepID=UPI0023F22887|nr:hybrid sensor histidine kinase/response regulator [Chlorogloeopsis fritschii]
MVETGQPLVKDELIYEDNFGHRRLIRAYDIRIAKFGDGFVATWRDVTDRRQAEAELRHQKQELAALVENSPDVVMRIDRELRYIYVNSVHEKATGLKSEELIGKTVAEVWKNEEQHQQWQINLQAAFQTGQTQIDEFGFPAPDGTIHFYQTQIVPEFTEEGSIDSVLTVTRDITKLKETETALRQRDSDRDGLCYVLDLTERKRSEQAVRESQERLNLALEAANMGCWDWNIQTGEVYWSANLERLFGLEPGSFDCRYKTVLAMIHPDDRQWILQAINGAVYEQQEYNVEFRFVKPDGKIRWAASRGQVFYDAIGNPVQMTGVDLDITDRKQAEEARVQALERERAARIELERASRMKDEFLAIVSHELRSPLNGILGWSRLLRTRRLSPDTTEQALAAIERNAQAQTQLIEDLLDISRIIRGQIRLNLRPTSLISAIGAALDTVSPTAQTKSIQIESRLNPNVGLVSGDPERLQQIVWNLLSNAVKFTPEGGRVEIRLERVDSYAQIQVIDTGKGINPEFLPYVFVRFRQADATTTRTQGGLGLGLAIVQNLVELHNGTVSVTSKGEGQGATFTVKLPLLGTDSAPSQQELSIQRQTEWQTTLNLQGLKILAVDDEADTREFLTTALSEYGANVTTAASTREALQILQLVKPDVLLSDIGMPGEDGYTLIRQIRQLPLEQCGQIPAAALTAYAREGDRLQALAAGFQMHVPKPVEPIQLLTVVAKLAGKDI